MRSAAIIMMPYRSAEIYNDIHTIYNWLSTNIQVAGNVTHIYRITYNHKLTIL